METLKQGPETAVAAVIDMASAETKALAQDFGQRAVQVEAADDPNVFESNTGIKCRVENYTSADITPEVIKGIADFYREMFAGSFDQYLTYPSQAEPISPQQVFNTPKGTYEPLEKLDSFDPATYPVHPETKEHAIFWHDPKTTLELFEHKAKQNSHFTIFRDLESNKIAGLMFGYASTLKEAFDSEEWENPIRYSGARPEKKLRNYKDFESKINQAWEKNNGPHLTENTNIYVYNCMATRKDLRGLDHFLRLTKNYFSLIPQDMKDSLYIVGEAKVGTKAHYIFTQAGVIQVPNILLEKDEPENGDPVIITIKLSSIPFEYL
jgi:hypothetical protein